MFKNIKKLSEFALLNERLVYEDAPKSAPDTSSEKEPSDAQKARAALMADVDTLVFAREEQVLKLLSGTDAYKKGDWRELNELFKKEFEKFGVKEKSAERLLKKFQKEAFDYLGLTGDPLAVIDGRLGIYTLYAFALKTNLQWPKGDVPAGCPRLKALIDKDIKKAYENYQNYPFAKAVTQAEFTKMYTRIKTTNRRFMADRANLGQWALALWYAGAGLDGTANRINFPQMSIFREEGYYNSPGIALTLNLPGYTQPVLVDTEGRLLLYNKDKKEYLTIDYEYDAIPMTPAEKARKPEPKQKDKPQTPPEKPTPPVAPKPAPKPEPKPAGDTPVAKSEPNPPAKPETPDAPAIPPSALAAKASIGLGGEPPTEGPKVPEVAPLSTEGRRLSPDEAEGIINRSRVNEGKRKENEKLAKEDRWLEFASKQELVKKLKAERPNQNWDGMLGELSADANKTVDEARLVTHSAGVSFDRGTALAFFENGKVNFYLVTKTSGRRRA